MWSQQYVRIVSPRLLVEGKILNSTAQYGSVLDSCIVEIC